VREMTGNRDVATTRYDLRWTFPLAMDFLHLISQSACLISLLTH
jgi:hypothetical protein